MKTKEQLRADAAVSGVIVLAGNAGLPADALMLGLLLYRAAPDLWGQWMRDCTLPDAIPLDRLQVLADNITAGLRDLTEARFRDA